MLSFSLSQCAFIAGDLLLQVGELSLELRRGAPCDAASVSFFSAARSISSCMIAPARTSSSSTGIESISMRSRDAASSTRSIALSGRKRSVM